MGSQQFCLRWNNHQSAVLSGFSKLLENETLVDVTIACAGVRIKAHKVVLSACSPYFQEIFEENPCKHPVIILKGFTFQDLKSIIDFMYKGEVNVNQQNLADFLKMAEELQVSGLMDVPSQQLQDGTRNHQETTESVCTKDDNRTNSGGTVLREFVGRARERTARTTDRGSKRDDYQSGDDIAMEHAEHHQTVGSNDRIDSDDASGAIPICPVNAELHIKEEIDLYDDDEDEEGTDSSRLLLERLTRPQLAASGRTGGVEQTASMSPYDLAMTSASHDLPPTVEMLESLPGHSSWNITQISHDGEPTPKSLKRSESVNSGAVKSPLKLLTSRRGRNLLVYQGYVTKRNSHWRRKHEKEYKCLARCHTNDTGVIKEIGQHNHDPVTRRNEYGNMSAPQNSESLLAQKTVVQQ